MLRYEIADGRFQEVTREKSLYVLQSRDGHFAIDVIGEQQSSSIYRMHGRYVVQGPDGAKVFQSYNAGDALRVADLQAS